MPSGVPSITPIDACCQSTSERSRAHTSSAAIRACSLTSVTTHAKCRTAPDGPAMAAQSSFTGSGNPSAARSSRTAECDARTPLTISCTAATSGGGLLGWKNSQPG